MADRTISLDSFIQPFNEHWLGVQIVVYRLMLQTFGLGTYMPYLAVLAALHVVVVLEVYAIARRSSGPWIAAMAGDRPGLLRERLREPVLVHADGLPDLDRAGTGGHAAPGRSPDDGPDRRRDGAPDGRDDDLRIRHLHARLRRAGPAPGPRPMAGRAGDVRARAHLRRVVRRVRAFRRRQRARPVHAGRHPERPEVRPGRRRDRVRVRPGRSGRMLGIVASGVLAVGPARAGRPPPTDPRRGPWPPSAPSSSSTRSWASSGRSCSMAPPNTADTHTSPGSSRCLGLVGAGRTAATPGRTVAVGPGRDRGARRRLHAGPGLERLAAAGRSRSSSRTGRPIPGRS